MLTPKCRPRDSHVRARVVVPQDRLCCWDHDLRRRNLVGFCEKLGLNARPLLVPGRLGRTWLCWQSDANPSLPAKVGNAGRFRQKAARTATNPYRKSQHLNTLDPLSLLERAARAQFIAGREPTSERRLETSALGARADFLRRRIDVRY